MAFFSFFNFSISANRSSVGSRSISRNPVFSTSALAISNISVSIKKNLGRQYSNNYSSFSKTIFNRHFLELIVLIQLYFYKKPIIIMSVNMCKTISNSQMQNYQLVVIHKFHHIIHKSELYRTGFIIEIHTNVERTRGKE